MKSCTLTYASSRFQWGNLTSSEPSRFIDEIDPKYLHFEAPQRGQGRSLSSGITSNRSMGGLNKTFDAPRPAVAATPRNLKPIATVRGGASDSLEYKVGYNVLHERFGKGKITKIEGQGADKKATIFFPHHGAKTLLLRFANLTVVEA